MFYNARWYDPSLRRFAQADTIVPPGVQGLDRYSYANNNPIHYTDPDGHAACYKDRIDDGPQCTHGGWINNYSNVIYDNWKYQDRVIEEIEEKFTKTSIDILTNITIASDTVSTGISFVEAAIADFFIVGTLILSGMYPEMLSSLPEAIVMDYYLASPFNPVGAAENGLGYVSLAATTLTDLLSQNTYIAKDGFYLGKDTIVAGRNTLLGQYPESNVDLIVNWSQLQYDMDRLNGAKPEGSINVNNVTELFSQIFWYDSPFQDISNAFR